MAVVAVVGGGDDGGGGNQLVNVITGTPLVL